MEMNKNEKGNWTPYNVRSIVRNVEAVFKSGNINDLRKGSYEFIILHMGFIAHYNLGGFQGSYEDLRDFAKNLLTSEYSQDENHNLREAARQERDSDFNTWYGRDYQMSVAQTMRGIVEVVKKHSAATEESEAEKEKANDLSVIRGLAHKHGISLEV
jgi:hypothetical protein